MPDPQQSGIQHHVAQAKVYAIDGLLDLTLTISAMHMFDARLAASECMKAYFYNHPAIRLHFLRRAIDGYTSGTDETANVLTTLLKPLDGYNAADPYQHWFAAVLLQHLIFENSDAKALAMSVAEGDASNGEEVVTCIQSISANLITGLQKGEDERVLVAYLMLLGIWLFEDPDAVNDFLGEGSNVQSLAQTVIQPTADRSLLQGLCAMLLGIVYEFSTKDSPIPRAILHSILLSQLGRDQFNDRLTKLREHVLMRDFEVLPQRLDSTPGGVLPDVYFDKYFVDFFKDNFSRLLRSIDQDPGIEMPVFANGAQKGISRELVDSLRSQLEQKSHALKKTEMALTSMEQELGQSARDLKRVEETSATELTRIKSVNEALQQHHETDTRFVVNSLIAFVLTITGNSRKITTRL